MAEPMNATEVLALLAEIFDEPVGHVTAATPREQLPGWDSLGHLVLMAKLDERFGLRLSQTELDRLTSVSAILEVLEQHQVLTRY